MKKMLIIWILVFLFSLFLVLGLFFINVCLERKISGLEQRIYSEEGALGHAEIEDMRQKVSKANKLLTELMSFYQKKLYFSGIFSDIYEIMPEGTYLTNASFTQNENEKTINVSLSGFSPTREKLLTLKSNIETKEGFQETFFPPSNWVKPVDINFSANFKIPLKKP